MRVPSLTFTAILLMVSLSFIDARTTPAEDYGKIVMKDVPMSNSMKDPEGSDSNSYEPGLRNHFPNEDSVYHKKRRNYDHKIPIWLDKYIQYKIASYLVDAPKYVKSYFPRNLDLKSAWEYYHSTNPRLNGVPESLSRDENSFFTRDFDKAHAWEWYYY